MSAITGIVACSAIPLSAFASSQWGTATRTISQPVATSAAICCRVAFTSAVFVVVIDWMRTGASPPTSTHPTLTLRDLRLSASILGSQSTWTGRSLSEDVKHDVAFLRLVELDQNEALPPAEHRLPPPNGNRLRCRRQEHRLDVRMPVLPLVHLVEVLRAALQVVVRVVDVLGRERLQPPPEVRERPILPFVDEQRARRVRAESDGRPVGYPRVLDRPLELVGQIDERVALPRGHLDGDGLRLHAFLLFSGATGRSNVN